MPRNDGEWVINKLKTDKALLLQLPTGRPAGIAATDRVSGWGEDEKGVIHGRGLSIAHAPGEVGTGAIRGAPVRVSRCCAGQPLEAPPGGTSRDCPTLMPDRS